MASTVSSPRIANSVRLILAMFRLYADIETDFGKAIVQILKDQYPDQDVAGEADPAQIGHKLMNIARKQLQYNDQDAMDAIQDFLTYVSTGSKYETDESGQRGKYKVDESGEPVLDEEGKPIPDPEGKFIPRVTPAPFDFTEGAKTWKEALGNMFSNLRRKGITRSIKKTERGQKERGIDEAFGRRTDDGGAEKGEERMPTPDETSLGRALDDSAALKSFYELMDKHIPDLKAEMSDDSRALFELVFDKEIGGFGSDIKENMGQATALKEEFPEVYERFLEKWGDKITDPKKLALKWSSHVGNLRKQVVEEIWDYIDEYMAEDEFQAFRDQFFSDFSPSAQQRQIEKKEQEKEEYQKMRDTNSVARLKAKLEKDGKLSDKDQKKLDRLMEKLKDQGVDVEGIEADAGAGAKGKRKKREEAKSSQAATLARAHHIASLRTVPAWVA